jgi:hypothetical protein
VEKGKCALQRISIIHIHISFWRGSLDYSAFRLQFFKKAFILRFPAAPSLDGAGWRGAILASHKVEDESSTLSFTGIRFDCLLSRAGWDFSARVKS